MSPISSTTFNVGPSWAVSLSEILDKYLKTLFVLDLFDLHDDVEILGSHIISEFIDVFDLLEDSEVLEILESRVT